MEESYNINNKTDWKVYTFINADQVLSELYGHIDQSTCYTQS